jgi:hypothetical protein
MTLVTGRLERAWMAGNIQCSPLSTPNSRWRIVRPQLEVPVSSWGGAESWGKIAFFDECRGPMQCFLRMKNFGLRPMLPHEKFSRFLVSFVGSLFCPTDPLSLLPAHGRQVYCDTYGLDREFGGFSRVAGVWAGKKHHVAQHLDNGVTVRTVCAPISHFSKVPILWRSP